MGQDRLKLTAVLAASAAFLAGCDRNDCRDPQGRPISCNTAHGGGGGHAVAGYAPTQVSSVTRGGFGSTGESLGAGGHGGAGE